MNGLDPILVKRAKAPGVCLCCGEEFTPSRHPNAYRVYKNKTHAKRMQRKKIPAAPYMNLRAKAARQEKADQI